MKIVEIPATQFNELTKNHPLASFEQTANWAKLKKYTGWQSFFIAYEDENANYSAYAMLLAKKLPLFNYYLFYSPHGYLLDYKNEELLKNFHQDLLSYLKKHRAFEIIIDPYLIYQERDIDGKIVENGEDNRIAVDNLKNLGYVHSGFNLYYENLQPRFLFRLNLEGKSFEELFKNFRYEARRRAKRQDYLAITVRELSREEIPVYKRLMRDTAKRRGFLDRSLGYYEQMYDAMHDDGLLHYYVAEIDFERCRQNVQKEIAKSLNKIYKLQSRSNSKHNENVIHEEEIVLNSNRELLAVVDKASQEYGNKMALSGVTLITYGQEAVMLLAGNDEKYLQHFMTSNIIVSNLIKLAQSKGYKYYNFYGITGDFNPQSEHYGLYAYKKQYGGEVVELIGQFSYVVAPLIKHLYDLGVKVYNLTKKFNS